MLFTHSMVCWPRLLSSTPVRLVCLIKPSITFHMPSTPSPVMAEHVYAPVVQPSVAGLKYLSTCSYSALAACARCLLSPSALLTSIASAVSITPFFMPCRSSPAPAMVITKKSPPSPLPRSRFGPRPRSLPIWYRSPQPRKAAWSPCSSSLRRQAYRLKAMAL